MEAPLVRSSSRLEAYSDALFSIVATVMVLPVAHTEIPEDEALSTSFGRLLLPKIIVYLYTFWIVSLLWTRNVELFEIIDRVDEFSVLMNLAMMMVITFFPFTFTLLGAYPLSGIAVQIFCGAFIILQSLRILLTWHVFRHPGMLKNEIKENHEEDAEKKKLYVSSASVWILSLLAFIVSFVMEPLALVILLLLPFGNYFWSCIVKLCTKCRRTGEDLSSLATFIPWRKRLLQETICKERIEFFSDGVFAIVATLIILDICEENIPDRKTVDEHGGKLDPVLQEDSYIFLAYAGSFLTVGLQWYVHHSLFHYVKEVSKLMMVFNFLCLMAVGMSPMAFKMTSTFDKHKGDNNESIAIQLNSTIILLTGLFQSALWIAALFDSEKCLYEAARHKGKDHTYLACKLAVLPLLSLLMFFLSLLQAFRATIFIGVQISAVAIYILLGLLFTEMRKWTRRRQLNSVLGDNGTSLENNPVEF